MSALCHAGVAQWGHNAVWAGFTGAGQSRSRLKYCMGYFSGASFYLA